MWQWRSRWRPGPRPHVTATIRGVIQLMGDRAHAPMCICAWETEKQTQIKGKERKQEQCIFIYSTNHQIATMAKARTEKSGGKPPPHLQCTSKALPHLPYEPASATFASQVAVNWIRRGARTWRCARIGYSMSGCCLTQYTTDRPLNFPISMVVDALHAFLTHYVFISIYLKIFFNLLLVASFMEYYYHSGIFKLTFKKYISLVYREHVL